MNAGLSYFLLFVCAYAAFGLIVGASVYLTLRAIEMWDHEYALIINILTAVALLFVLAPYLSILEGAGFTILLLLLGGGSGFRFHQKSGGASASSGAAMLLMGVATLLAMEIESTLLMSLSFRLPRRPPPPPPYLNAINDYLYLFLLFIPVSLTPFLLWVYQNSRLRPGVDRHLSEGEEVESASS